MYKRHIYNISVNVIDDDGTPTNVKSYFSINDTTIPIITFYYPSPANTSVILVGSNVTVNLTFSDLNLYAYNFTMNYPNGTMFRNFSKVGMSSADFNLSFVQMMNTSGIYILNIEVADNHHLSGTQLVKDWDVVTTKAVSYTHLTLPTTPYV